MRWPSWMPSGCCRSSPQSGLIATSIGWNWPACPKLAPNERPGSNNWGRTFCTCWRLVSAQRHQHYEEVGQQVRWRDGPLVSSQQRVVSPYDPEARCSRKREISWLGFKVHFTETCEEDEQSVHVITQVTTTASTTADAEMLSPILDDLRRQDLAPGEHFVDMGYTSGEDLVKEADLGTQVIGPVGPTPGWQAQQHGGFAPADFALDWDAEFAICPQGQHSSSWKQGQDGKRGIIKIHFATATCRQ